MKKPDINYEIGFRAIKSSIVVFLCLLISFALGRHSAFYSSIAAIVCMQQTPDATYKTGLNRIIGTVMGGITGYGILEITKIFPNYNNFMYIIVTPILVLGLISLCNIINKKAASAMGCIVFLSIVLNVDRAINESLIYVINRIVDTSIGIILAVIVNKYLFKNKTNKE